jgi:hypothetical protein
MRSRTGIFGVGLLFFLTSSAFAMECSSSAAERSNFVSAALIKELDQGRGANGSYPAWVERYMRDADSFAELLDAFCAKSPNGSFDNAFAEVVQLKR